MANVTVIGAQWGDEATGQLGQCGAHRHQPLGALRTDQDLRARAFETAEHIIERIRRRCHDQPRTRARHPLVEPDQRRQLAGVDLRTVGNHHIAQHPARSFEQRLERARLAHGQTGGAGILGEVRDPTLIFAEQRQRERENRIALRSHRFDTFVEIGKLGHANRSCFP